MLKKKNWSRILKRWKTWLIYPVLSWSEKLIFMPYLRKTFRIITYWHSNFQKNHLNNVPTTAWQMQDRKSQKLLQYFENFFSGKGGQLRYLNVPFLSPSEKMWIPTRTITWNGEQTFFLIHLNVFFFLGYFLQDP